MGDPLSALCLELFEEVLSYLKLPDMANLRLSCRKLQQQSRYSFTTQYLRSCRIRLNFTHLSTLLLICSDTMISNAIQEMHISLYMADPRCGDVLRRIDSDVDTPCELHDAMKMYASVFTTENSFYDIVPSMLAKVFANLPKLRLVSLSSNTKDIEDYISMEVNILRGLSKLPYREYHQGDCWRFMKLQPEKVISITLHSLVSSPVQTRIKDLVIDRRSYAPGQVQLPDPRGIPLPQTLSLTSIQNLELSITEHAIPSAYKTFGWSECWLTRLINSASNLTHLTLRFCPVATFDLMREFLNHLHLKKLETLSISYLTWIGNCEAMVKFAQGQSRIKLEFATSIFSVSRTLDSMHPRTPNIRCLLYLKEKRLGHLWFSDQFIPSNDMITYYTKAKVSSY
jgi:hypothetical protein